MEAKHTPGPWTDDFDLGHVDGANGEIVCYLARGPSEESRANGRIISAAPEMVAALEHAIAIFLEDDTLGNSVDYNDVRSQIAEALRKARGF